MLPDFCGLQYVHSMKFCPYCIPYSLRSNEHFLLINSLLCLSFSGRMTALDCFSYCKLYYVFFCWQEIYVISLKLFNIFFLPLFRNFEHPMDISIASLHFFSHILRHFKIGSVRKCGILSSLSEKVVTTLIFNNYYKFYLIFHLSSLSHHLEIFQMILLIHIDSYFLVFH